MSFKVLKLVAVPAVLGIASLRVYALDEEGADGQLSPRQLPIYSPSPGHGRFVEEHPGALQGGFAALRGRVESRVQTAKGSLRTMKSGAVNLYHAGEDIYYYLKDPPPDLLPRVSLIAVLGFSGLFLARNGSPFKRLLFPVGMASVGIAVCYPAQTLAMLKGGGKKAYNVSQWSASAVAALWKMKPDIESAASASASPSEGPEVASQPVHTNPVAQPSSAASCTPPPPSKDSSPTDLFLADAKLPPEPAMVPAPPNPWASVTGQPVPTAGPGMEEPSPPIPAEVPEQKAGFSADSKLMDFGQSNPEDSDLYSTRS